MICSHIRKFVYTVKLFPLKRRHRRILNKNSVSVFFHYSMSPYTVVLRILNCKSFGVQPFVGFQSVNRPPANRFIMKPIAWSRKIYCATDIMNLSNRNAIVKQRRNSNNNIFSHSICKQIRSRINKNAVSDSIVPIIIMRKPSQRSL